MGTWPAKLYLAVTATPFFLNMASKNKTWLGREFCQYGQVCPPGLSV